MKPANYAPVYCALYPDLAEIARGFGYALAVHGSLGRDMDLICIPWVDQPASPQVVIDAITSRFAIREVAEMTIREHGREVHTLSISHGECFIDLSFMPLAATPSPNPVADNPAGDPVVNAPRVRAAEAAEQETHHPNVNKLPPQDVLQEMFDYSPETGEITRKALSSAHFIGNGDPRGPEWSRDVYNTKCAGKPAFTTVDRDGYKRGRVRRQHYFAHRVIWKLVHGTDPEIIDHINGDTGDNRIANLRSGTIADNSRNCRRAPGATSKYRGVCWVDRDKKWAARISSGDGKKISLGYHDDEIEAARAYDAAAASIHGEFAILNFPPPPAAEGSR